jgi:hypothetical protein
MVKEWIRRAETGLIGGYLGSIFFAIAMGVIVSDWHYTFGIIAFMTFWMLLWLAGSEILIWHLGKDDKPLMEGCSCPVPGRNYHGNKVLAYMNGTLKYDSDGELRHIGCPIHGNKIGD